MIDIKEKIALCVIADDNAIEDGFERMIESVKAQVDGIYFTYTGSDYTVRDHLWQIVQRAGVACSGADEFSWVNDFSAARNHVFKMALSDGTTADSGQWYDWLFWLDCDDVMPEGGADLQSAIVEVRKRRAHGALLDYQYQYDHERGKPIVTHAKERLFRADLPWNWIYPIHENCVGAPGMRMTHISPTPVVRHMRKGSETRRHRNRHMIADWYHSDPENSRAIMFMGHLYKDLAEDATAWADKVEFLKRAMKLYRDFLKMEDDGDDAYVCNRQIAECLLQLGRYNDSIDIDLQGVKMAPGRLESYIGIAMSYMLQQDYDRAIKWAHNALWVNVEDTTSIVDNTSTYKALIISGDAYTELGKFQEAETAYIDALVFFNDDFTQRKVTEAEVRRRDQQEQNEIKVLDPRGSVRDVCRNAKGSNGKSIAFFQPGSLVWNKRVLNEEGLGGTETTIIRVAEKFAADHWRVVIFGSPGEEADTWEQSGIEWYEAGTLDIDEHFDVFATLRDPRLLDIPVTADKKILWLHDISAGDCRFDENGNDRFSKCDVILCPSEFHLKHISRVYKFREQPPTAQVSYIANGFQHSMFRFDKIDDRQRDPKRFVYASSPDRGLVRLLELWPEIAGRLESEDSCASLRIFYGFDNIDKLIEAGHPSAGALQFLKNKILKQIDYLKANGHEITFVGKIPESELAKEFKKAGAMLYPANFMETFGIVFVQAMAAGCVPVVPDLGFLPYLGSQYSYPVVNGSPDNETFGERFIDAAETATNVPVTIRMELREQAHSYDWSSIFEYWRDIAEKTEELTA